MAARPLPDRELLLKLLRYEPETGKLFWRERSPDMFKPTERYTLEQKCNAWNRRYAGKEAFTTQSDQGYFLGRVIYYGEFKAHRVIWCMAHGTWPAMLDHDDQNRRNNRLGNLIISDHQANGRNATLSRRNRSGRIGVNWKAQDKRWRAKIRHGGKYIELGTYRSFDAACAARDQAEKRYGYSPRHGSRKAP